MKIESTVLNSKTELADISISTIELPPITEDEVLLEMISAGINPIDYECASGPNSWVDVFPHYLGNEGLGKIIGMGKSVKGFNIGDIVLAYNFWGSRHGMFGEKNIVNQNNLAMLPEGLGKEWAASPIGLLSIYHIFYKRGKPAPGQSILIEGSGGVGMFAIQFAKKFGLKTAVITSQRSEAWAKELGADLVNGNTKEFAANGFDIILSTTHTSSVDKYGSWLAKNGRFISTMAVASESNLNEASSHALFNQNSWEWFLAEPDGKQLTNMLLEAKSLGIHVPISETFSLKDISRALQKAASGGNKGKILVTINEN